MGKKELRLNKINQIARLLNHESGELVKIACRGKYRGYNDYSIKFNSGDELYLTYIFKNIDDELDRIINKINHFNNNKEYIMQYNKEYSIFDNKLALEKGFKPYELVDIKISNKDTHVLWAYAIVKIENELRYIIETGFSYNVFNITKDTVFEVPKKNYFIAGGLQEHEVDFVWHNVGMSTKNDLYSLDQNVFLKEVLTK